METAVGLFPTAFTFFAFYLRIYGKRPAFLRNVRYTNSIPQNYYNLMIFCENKM